MRDYLLTAFIVAILPVCFARPWLGVVAWYWFGLMNPHRLTFGFAYNQVPFAMLIGGATLLGLLVAKDRRPIPWNRELLLIMVLIFYFTLTSVFAWGTDVAWVQWDKISKILLMTFVASMFIYGKERIRVLLLTIVFSLGFYSVKSIIYVIRTGGGGRIDGIPGSFLDGNTFMGLAFCMVTPLMFTLARMESRIWMKRTLYVLAALTLISIIFTYSRGAYVGAVAILPFMFLSARRRTLAASILIPALLILPNVLPERAFQRVDDLENYKTESSANQRFLSWTVSWNVAKDYPFTGAGFNFESSGNDDRWWRYASEEYAWALDVSRGATAAHSIYFQVLGQHGFIAFGLYVFLLIGTLVTFQSVKRLVANDPSRSWIADYASGLQIGIIGFMVTGAFLSSAYFDLTYIYIALAAILRKEAQTISSVEGGTTNMGPLVMGVGRNTKNGLSTT